MENSGSAFLITDGPLLEGVKMQDFPALRRVFTIRKFR